MLYLDRCIVKFRDTKKIGAEVYGELRNVLLILLRRTMEIVFTYTMAQQPLKSFDCPLMRVSLSDSILVHLFSTRGRVMGDKSIASWAN